LADKQNSGEFANPPIEVGSRIYFIGIGGIGMSALARYFHLQGKTVSGYDKTETPLTKQLVAEGIPVHYEDNIELAIKKRIS
jgi:UDP-N-acetylmuramate--alanine ligase